MAEIGKEQSSQFWKINEENNLTKYEDTVVRTVVPPIIIHYKSEIASCESNKENFNDNLSKRIKSSCTRKIRKLRKIRSLKQNVENGTSCLSPLAHFCASATTLQRQRIAKRKS